MSKTSLLASAAVLAALIDPAAAADLGRVATKAPPPPPYTLIDPWTGFYIGGAIGYGWNRGAGDGFCNVGACGTTSFATSPQGVVGGGHAGVGGRFANNWYIGGEVAAGIGTLDGTAQNPGFIGNINSKTNALFSVSGRLGYILTPNIMAYGRLGWAWANSEFTVTGTDGSQFSTKPTVDGALVGAGVDFALTQNWIVGFEYQHYFLSDINTTTTGIIAGAVPVTLSAHVDNHIDTVLGRLSYKF